jgi:hypothetical protein
MHPNPSIKVFLKFLYSFQTPVETGLHNPRSMAMAVLLVMCHCPASLTPADRLRPGICIGYHKTLQIFFSHVKASQPVPEASAKVFTIPPGQSLDLVYTPKKMAKGVNATWDINDTTSWWVRVDVHTQTEILNVSVSFQGSTQRFVLLYAPCNLCLDHRALISALSKSASYLGSYS